MKIKLFIDGIPVEKYVPQGTDELRQLRQIKAHIRNDVIRVYGDQNVTINLNLAVGVELKLVAPDSFDSAELDALVQFVEAIIQRHKF